MGAWGAGPFENDGALDWVIEVVSAPDLGPVRRALRVVLDQEYVEAPDAQSAVAAAEVVAATRGNGIALPDEVGAWLQSTRVIATQDDVALARAGVARVRGDASELNELWAETGDDAWDTAMDGLVARLAASG